MRIRLRDWIEERNERTTVSDQHPVLTCSQDGILLQSAYFKKQIASQDNTGYKIVHRGDFTYRAMSDTGRFYIHQMDCAEIGIVSPAYPVFYLKAGAPIVPEYLLLFFESELFHELVSSKSKGSTRLSLRLSKIGDITVEFPEVDEQNKRVALMNSLSQQIEDLNLREKSYGDTVKSLFNDLFGDVIRNTKEWPIFLLNDLGKTRLGKMLDAKKQIAGNSYPYLANQNVQWFRFDLTEVKTMSFLEKEKATFLLKKGDLLITEGGDVGRCAIWNDELPECYYQKALHKFRCDQGKIIPEYLAWWFKTRSDDDGFAYVTGAGATIRHLPGDKLKALEVPVPPLNLQKRFQSGLTQINKLRFNAIKQKELFTEYRSSFLQDFFEGGNKHERI